MVQATPRRPGVEPDLWRIGARPQTLRDSAALWRTLGEVTVETGTSVEAESRDLLAVWSGASADAYREHQRQVVAGYAAVAGVTGRMAELLDSSAAVLHQAQSHLDDARSRLIRRLPERAGKGGSIRYDQSDPEQVAAVEAAVREAGEIRADADARLAALASEMDRIRADLWSTGDAAASAAALGAWPTLPETGLRGQVLVTGNRIVLNATGGDDTIAIGVDPVTGEHVVQFGGGVHRFPPTADLVVRAGAGYDTITVQPGTRLSVTLLGGAGDDRIRGDDGAETVLGLWGADTILGGGGADRIFGGGGRDYLDGQRGDDILTGGAGDDTLYGLDGADRIWGDAGNDYIDGGAGADLVVGGAGNDAGFGGGDGDAVLGGQGDDALYGGGGADLIAGGPGVDRSYRQADDTALATGADVTVELTDVGGFIRIEGSAEFVARVQSDLDALRASPRGAQMLGALQASHEQSRSGAADLPLVGGLFADQNTLVIRETQAANGFAGRDDLPLGRVDGYIEYNPTFDDLAAVAPPVVVLYHELAHVYDHFHGTMQAGVHGGPDNPGVPNREREATGLPIDHDGDPTTPDRLHPAHPFALTENGLREELGVAARTRY
jgi:Ca2+-binding RTX toxin-like protein